MADKIDVEFGGSVDGLQRAADEATSAIKGILSPIEELKHNFGTIAESVAAAFAVEKIVQFFEQMEQLAVSTQRVMAILGVSASTVDTLDAAAKSVGSSIESVTMALTRMSLGLAKAEDGTGKEAAALKALHINLQDFMKLDTEGKLKKLADGFEHLKDGMEKTAVAQALGRSFAQMLPLLNEGAEGIQKFSDMVKRAGSEATPEFLHAMHELHEQSIELEKSFQGLGITIATAMSGPIAGLQKLMIDLTQEMNNSIKSGGLMKFVFDDIVLSVKNLAEGIVLLVGYFQITAVQFRTILQGMGDDWKFYSTAIPQTFSIAMRSVGDLFKGLVAVATAVAQAIGNSFLDLGILILAALSGNMALAQAAFGRLRSAAQADATGIGAAFAKLGGDTGKSVSEISKVWSDGWKELTDTTKRRVDDANKEITAIQKRTADTIKLIYQQANNEIMHSADKTTAHLDLQANKRAEDAIAAAMRQIGIIDQQFSAQAERINHEYKMSVDFFGSAEAQKTASLRSNVQARLAAELDVLNTLQAKYALTSAQYAKIEDEKTKLTQKASNEILKIEDQAAEATWQKWKSTADQMASTFSSGISSMVTGGKTLSQAMAQITRGLIDNFINMMTKMAFEWIAKQLFMATASKAVQATDVAAHVTAEGAKTAATTAGVAARTGAEASGASLNIFAQIGQAISFIFTQAAKTFAGVFAFLSPVMGPAAAGPATASEAEVMAQAAVLPAAAVGTDYVMRTGVALIHQGEKIIPAADVGAPYSGAGAGVTVQFNVTAWDARSVQNWLHGGGAKQVAQATSQYLTRNPNARGGY